MITDEQKSQLSARPYWEDYICFPQPGWHNIFPGKTTMEDALAIIQADPTLHKIRSSGERVFIWERASSFQATGYIQSSYRQPGLVYGIYVGEAYESELLLKDAITIYGTPLALY